MTNPTEPMSLREKIIALGTKGLHRTMLAVYAPDIQALFTAELETLRKQADYYQDVVQAIPITALDALIERVKTK